MRVNVEGTRNVLRLPRRTRRGCERLHYVSTAYVSGTRHRASSARPTSTWASRFKNHYEETKFLAEVEVARSGLPATIYRPAIVVGDSRTGETAKFDGPYFTLSAMERVPSPGLFLQRRLRARNPANLVPVDFVVEALARPGRAAGSRGEDLPPDRSRAAVRVRGRAAARARAGQALRLRARARRPWPRPPSARARCSGSSGMPRADAGLLRPSLPRTTPRQAHRGPGAAGRRAARPSRRYVAPWWRSTARTAAASAARRWSSARAREAAVGGRGLAPDLDRALHAAEQGRHAGELIARGLDHVLLDLLRRLLEVLARAARSLRVTSPITDSTFADASSTTLAQALGVDQGLLRSAHRHRRPLAQRRRWASRSRGPASPAAPPSARSRSACAMARPSHEHRLHERRRWR